MKNIEFLQIRCYYIFFQYVKMYYNQTTSICKTRSCSWWITLKRFHVQYLPTKRGVIEKRSKNFKLKTLKQALATTSLTKSV